MQRVMFHLLNDINLIHASETLYPTPMSNLSYFIRGHVKAAINARPQNS